MTDEHLMRHWADAHSDFSGDLDRGLLRLGRFIGRRLQGRHSIGEPYASATCTMARSAGGVSPTARAALAGALACVATTALLVTVALLAAAGAADGPSFHTAMSAGAPIVSHTILA